MNLNVLFMETIVLTLVFNAVVFISLYRNPIWWIHDYPEDIQEEYFKNHERIPVQPLSKNVIVKKGGAIILTIIIFILLMKYAGAETFSQGFLGSYFIWLIISIWDCVFMDWVLFANIKAIRLPGTEHMDKSYHQKRYHFIRGCFGLLIGVVPCLITGLGIFFLNR
ncbi:hypothetical protein [Terrisporobacter vanillatitrophus]|uniref:hypothetical protein n=1 Tax=Terrisporobacter vanillatitrophus TaxID=3058402 RepID=UPI003367AF5C